MNDAFKTLQTLIDTNTINLSDYYTTSFRRSNSIQLQAEYNSELVVKLVNSFDTLESFNKSIQSSGYVEIYFKLNGTSVNITLT